MSDVECERCHESYYLRDGMDPTPNCDTCAHEIVQELRAENERLEACVKKVNDIRNSIIALQTMNWSEHIYPLVAALEAAGVAGKGYPGDRENYGTILQQNEAMRKELAATRKCVLALHECVAVMEGKRCADGFNAALTDARESLKALGPETMARAEAMLECMEALRIIREPIPPFGLEDREYRRRHAAHAEAERKADKALKALKDLEV